MKKNLILSLLCFTLSLAARAQGTGMVGASEMVTVSLSNVIEISFAGTKSNFGELVSLVFDDPNDYLNGIESKPQELKVRTNKAFNVNIHSKTPQFVYTGNEMPAPQVPVDNTLSIAVTNNNTGGSATNGNSYFGITSVSQNLITGGGVGNNQNYEVKYKAKPNTNIPEGTYSVDLIYTASQE
jgi:hypothetical protein